MARLTLKLTNLTRLGESYDVTYDGIKYHALRFTTIDGSTEWELEPVDHLIPFVYVYECMCARTHSKHDLREFENARAALGIKWDLTNMRWSRKMIVEGVESDVFSGIWVGDIPVEVCHVLHYLDNEQLHYVEAWSYVHGDEEISDIRPLPNDIAEELFARREEIRREIILRREGNMQIAVGLVHQSAASQGQVINDTLGTIAQYYWGAFPPGDVHETAAHLLPVIKK